LLIKLKKTDPNKVFPQANDIYKIIKYVNSRTFSYYDHFLQKVEFVVVRRQINYYQSAANFLDLLDENEPTALAHHIFTLDKNTMLINVCQLILQNEIFFHYYKNRDLDYVADYLVNVYKMRKSTAKRRASTVKAWVKWCDVIIKENNIVIEEG